MIQYPAELWDVPRIAAYHHEKMDGTGPFGIRGDSIPLAARIISVADVFDALVSNRPYRAALPPEEVLAELDKGSGRDWDPVVIGALRAALDDVLAEVYSPDYESIAPNEGDDEDLAQAA